MTNYYQISALRDFNASKKEIIASIENASILANSGTHIRFLTYRRFYDNGTMLYLFNHQAWMGYVLEKELWISQNFIHQIQCISDHNQIEAIWDTAPSPQDSTFGGLYAQDIWFGQSIYRRRPGYIEAFSFAGRRDTPEVLAIYKHKKSLLHTFILQFYQRAEPLIKQYDKQALVTFSIIPYIASSLAVDAQVEQTIEDTMITHFPLDIGTKTYQIPRRKMQCLLLKIRGYPAREIALYLKQKVAYTGSTPFKYEEISQRTVEGHFTELRILTGHARIDDLIRDVSQSCIVRTLLENPSIIFGESYET